MTAYTLGMSDLHGGAGGGGSASLPADVSPEDANI
jgi:hypothetical protein